MLQLFVGFVTTEEFHSLHWDAFWCKHVSNIIINNTKYMCTISNQHKIVARVYMTVDCFVFSDPALLEGEENTDGDFEELQQKPASTEPNKSTESQLHASTSKRSKCQLNKKEREHVIQSLEVISGETLLDIVVNDLSTKVHMHHYQEREELMISLVDSSGEELKTICTGLAKSFIELYAKCDKGKEKYG